MAREQDREQDEPKPAEDERPDDGDEATVEEQSEQSFPASDPPSY